MSSKAIALANSHDLLFIQDAGNTKLDWVQREWARENKRTIIGAIFFGIIGLGIGAGMFIHDIVKSRRQNKHERFSDLVGKYVKQVEKAGNYAECVAVKADLLFDRIIALTDGLASDKDRIAVLKRANKDRKAAPKTAKVLLDEALKNGIKPALISPRLTKKIRQQIGKTFDTNVSRAAARRLIADPLFQPQASQLKLFQEQVKKGYFSSVDQAKKTIASAYVERELVEDMRIIGYGHGNISIDASDVVITCQNGQASLYEGLPVTPGGLDNLATAYAESVVSGATKKKDKAPAPLGDERLETLLFDEIVDQTEHEIDKDSKISLDAAKKRISDELKSKGVKETVRKQILKGFQENVTKAAGRNLIRGAKKNPKDLHTWLFDPNNQKVLTKKYKGLVKRGIFASAPSAHKAVASAFAERAIIRQMKRQGIKCTGLKVNVNALSIEPSGNQPIILVS